MSGSQDETFEDKVNGIVSTIERDAEGKLIMPENLDDVTQYAVRSEVRRRDTQSALSKERSRTQRLQEENDLLATNYESDVVKNLSAKEQADLAELKTTDPDAWRTRINELENTKREEFKEKRKSIADEAGKKTELQRRQEALDEAKKEYGDVFTDDALANDIPPRLVNMMERGEITYADFLTKAAKILGAERVVESGAKGKGDGNTDFSNLPGGKSPTAAAGNEEEVAKYRGESW